MARPRKYSVEDVRIKRVFKDNALVQRSRFSLSLHEQKVILYLLSQISPEDTEFHEYTITIKDYCKLCGIQGNSAYQEVKDSIYSLSQKAIWLTLSNNTETLVRWINKPYIEKDSGVIRVRLDEDLKPFLLQLKSNYTSYQLIYVLSFKSKYSLRLYELLNSVHYDPSKEFIYEWSIDDLKKRLDAELDTYKKFGRFNERVLIPSIAEINQYSDKEVSCIYLKKGRFVERLRFIIRTKAKDEKERIKNFVNIELGLDPGQTTLYDFLPEYIKKRNGE